MQDLVNQLKRLREEVFEQKQFVDTAKSELEKTNEWDEYQRELQELDIIEQELKLVDDQLREEAIKSYQETGNKKPVDGINIIILKSLDYEQGRAIAWAVNNAINMLKLDKRAFEKHAKAVADTVPLNFVNITEKPSVRIAKDLS